jgi:ribosomal protein S18 acetylase RimI-like enzyme
MDTCSDVQIRMARLPDDYEAARTLLLEYSTQLNIDLCFQGFTEELASLPIMYGSPTGRLLLASADGGLLGCVGIRALATDRSACEMKRLYVRGEGRGRGVGRALASASIVVARELGYTRMVLDTLDSMRAARALYADLGFRATEPYYLNPNADVAYLELTL